MSSVRRLAPVSQRLLDAAERCFAQHGFEGASTRAIAAQAGAPQGLVRHHFGSKEGLWAAVLARGVEAAAAELDGADGAGSPLTVAGWLAIVERRAELAAVVLHALLEGGPRAELARQVLAPVLERVRALHRRAQPLADERLFVLWLAASLAGPLTRQLGRRTARAAREGQAAGDTPARARELDVLFAWLIGPAAPPGLGPFAVATAHAALRGPGEQALGKGAAF